MNFLLVKGSNTRRLLFKQLICEMAVGFPYAANTTEVHLLNTCSFSSGNICLWFLQDTTMSCMVNFCKLRIDLNTALTA